MEFLTLKLTGPKVAAPLAEKADGIQRAVEAEQKAIDDEINQCIVLELETNRIDNLPLTVLHKDGEINAN